MHKNNFIVKYVICKIQTIFNIDSFVLFVIQTEVLCQIIKRFLFVSAKKEQAELSFVSFFNDLFIKCSGVAVCTPFLDKCQFIQNVNNWPFSSIEWNSDLTDKKYWPKCLCEGSGQHSSSSHFVSGQRWAFSNLNFFSRG